MCTLDIGEGMVLFSDWFIARIIGETHILLARGDERVLYDCKRDRLIGDVFHAKETWDPKNEPENIDPAKMGGLEKIISCFQPEEEKGLVKLLTK